MHFTVGIGNYDQEMFERVANYSVLGRHVQAGSYSELQTQAFVDVVISPLGIACFSEGETKLNRNFLRQRAPTGLKTYNNLYILKPHPMLVRTKFDVNDDKTQYFFFCFSK